MEPSTSASPQVEVNYDAPTYADVRRSDFQNKIITATDPKDLLFYKNIEKYHQDKVIPPYFDPVNFLNDTKKFKVKNGKLFYLDGKLVLKEQAEKLDAIFSAHVNSNNNNGTSHRSAKTTKQILQRNYWWPPVLMEIDVDNVVNHCKICNPQAKCLPYQSWKFLEVAIIEDSVVLIVDLHDESQIKVTYSYIEEFSPNMFAETMFKLFLLYGMPDGIRLIRGPNLSQHFANEFSDLLSQNCAKLTENVNGFVSYCNMNSSQWRFSASIKCDTELMNPPSDYLKLIEHSLIFSDPNKDCHTLFIFISTIWAADKKIVDSLIKTAHDVRKEDDWKLKLEYVNFAWRTKLADKPMIEEKEPPKEKSRKSSNTSTPEAKTAKMLKRLEINSRMNAVRKNSYIPHDHTKGKKRVFKRRRLESDSESSWADSSSSGSDDDESKKEARLMKKSRLAYEEEKAKVNNLSRMKEKEKELLSKMRETQREIAIEKRKEAAKERRLITLAKKSQCSVGIEPLPLEFILKALDGKATENEIAFYGFGRDHISQDENLQDRSLLRDRFADSHVDSPATTSKQYYCDYYDFCKFSSGSKEAVFLHSGGCKFKKSVPKKNVPNGASFGTKTLVNGKEMIKVMRKLSFFCVFPKCLKTHSSEADMYKCMESHIVTRANGKLFCSYCISEFKSGEAQRHVRLPEHKRYKCDFCLYTAQRFEAVDKHMMGKHLNVEPLVCDFYQCTFSTRCFVAYVEHRRDNHAINWEEGDKESCLLCKKDLTYTTDMKELVLSHFASHTNISLFTCYIDDVQCITFDDIKTHFDRHHPKQDYKENSVMVDISVLNKAIKDKIEEHKSSKETTAKNTSNVQEDAIAAIIALLDDSEGVPSEGENLSQSSVNNAEIVSATIAATTTVAAPELLNEPLAEPLNEVNKENNPQNDSTPSDEFHDAKSGDEKDFGVQLHIPDFGDEELDFEEDIDFVDADDFTASLA